MSRYVTGTIHFYAFHAREANQLLNYDEFLTLVASLPSKETTTPITRSLNFALSDAVIQDGVFKANVIAGSPGEVPLYFDYVTGRTERGTTPAGKWLARTSRIVIALRGDRRTLALETNGSGVTASRLEIFFQKLAKSNKLAMKPSIDFVPIPSPSLLDEIQEFERIRVASAMVARPNFDWSDFNTRLNALADESDAHTAEATVKAPKGESLSFTRGLVGLIIGSISAVNPNVKDFRIIGRKRGNKKDTIISSLKHNLRSFYTINENAGYLERIEAIDDAAISLMDRSANSDPQDSEFEVRDAKNS